MVHHSPTHLFLSYATEDWVFAEWLARKLAAEGYAVWFDRIKLLGGESWPRSIEEAFESTGRLLAVMTSSSAHKDLPLKERTTGFSIGRDRGIDDFVIPLRLDDAKWDWTLRDVTPIPFQDNWAIGLRQLLKKLEQIDFPRALPDGALRARMSMEPEKLVIPERETLRLNVIETKVESGVLRAYTLLNTSRGSVDTLKNSWAFYSIGQTAVALAPPPMDVAHNVTLNPAQCSWRDCDNFLTIPIRVLIPALVRSSMWVRLRRAGYLVHPKKRNMFYLPGTFTPNGWLQFEDVRGRMRKLRIRRFKTVRRRGQKQKIFFHFAFRVDLAKGLDTDFYIQIMPTVMLFTEDGTPIVDDEVNSLRRKITAGWFNGDWLERFLAAEQLLQRTQLDATDGLTLAATGVSLEAPFRLDEDAIGKPTPVVEEESEDAGEVIEHEPLATSELDNEN